MKLTIELVPSSCFYKNLRSELPRKKWDFLRKGAYQKANHKCEICGGQGHRHPVECHEIWNFDDATGVQSLVGLTALCPACHEVKHIGLAELNGRFDQARKHLMKVNGMNKWDADGYIAQAFDAWENRSRIEWELDISWLDQIQWC